MVSLGFWQLNRLDQRQSQNQQVQEKFAEQSVGLRDLRALGPGQKDDLEFRRIIIRGQFNDSQEGIVRNRTKDGRPGVWVLTPFESSGSAIIVNRGWVPRELSDPDCRPEGGELNPDTIAPVGEIQITGLLRKTEGTSSDSEPKKCLSRIELDRFQNITDFAYWVQLTENPIEDGPRLLDFPDRGNGPHLSYAAQWFIFALIALVGYPLILRHNYKRPDSSSKSKAEL